jgi:acetyl-CoA decarbonylase/synthase complex subunit gamma
MIMKNSFIVGNVTISDSAIPLISAQTGFNDFMGAVMVRWGIRRDHYRVSPGLYALGNPGPGSDVFVTANYKLSFDYLRKNLEGMNGWILVLDTNGVNVWCAAGKGTFGTKELVNRIKLVSLDKIVNHKRLILPQLGATGVSAYKVKAETGFNVHYGPVRAADIKKFINDGYRADKKMRKVNFGLIERIKLIPNDFMYGKYYLAGAMALFFIISGVSGGGFSYKGFYREGGPAVLKIFLAYFSGIILTPILLPYIPGRHFSFKGFLTGFLVFLCLALLKSAGNNFIEILSWFFIITTVSSFMAMNWTGSSTYTSLSGVRKEMKISVPLQIGFALIGIVLQVVGKFI